MRKFLMKKKRGGIQILPLMALLMLLIIIFLGFIFELATMYCKLYTTKDQLDASNLATYKNLSQQHLADTGNLIFDEADVPKVYDTLRAYIISNFNLDNNMTAFDNGFIDGQVTITDVRLFNVEDGKTTEYGYNFSNMSFTKINDNVTTTVLTPNGRKVKQTSIYVEVKLKLKSIFTYNHAKSKEIKIRSYTDITN